MSIWQENTLFPSSKSASIAVPESHELVRLTGLIDWVSLTHIAMTCREKTRKRLTGVEPRYRQLLGALVLMATRGCNYRDAEDLIFFYAPARYLCDLMDSEIGLDHVTIFEFTQMLGPTGMESINKVILQHAVKAGLCNPKIMMSDTTAQEARIPYPTEAGLMNRFMAIASRTVGNMRDKFDTLKAEVKEASAKVRGLLRNSHLFAKGRDQKRKIERKMYHTVNEIQKKIASAIESGASVKSRGGQELKKVNSVMKRLLRAGVYFGESKTRCGHGVLQTVNTRAPRDIPSRAENIWLRSRWRQRCKHLLCKKVRGQARGYRASRQASLAGEQENGGAHSMRAGPGRRINRHDKIITLRLHKTTSIQLRGIGEVRASCDFGIQHEKNGSSSHCDGAGVMRSLSGTASKLPRRGKRIQKMA